MSKKKPYSEIQAGKAVRANENTRKQLAKAAKGAPEWYVKLIDESVDACNKAVLLDDQMHVQETAESKVSVRPELAGAGKKYVAAMEKQLKARKALADALCELVKLGVPETK